MSAPFSSRRPARTRRRTEPGSRSTAEPRDPVAPQLGACVTAVHGRLLRVRTDDGREALARPPGRGAQIVCGDRVLCERDTRHDELRIVSVAPRKGALFRSNARGQAEPVAANLTLLATVVAPLPVPDFYVVDRYLSAARCAGIAAAVVLNKCELRCGDEVAVALAAYTALGLPVCRVSAHAPTGLAELRALLHDQTAMLVGQSGVGKSSLSRALIPLSAPDIGALLRDDEGRHTTTASRLYDLPDGGALIDSPGVRDFAPAIDRLDAMTLGFAEIEALGSACRFADCRHLREPDCAVREALGLRLDARRYESYRRLRRLYERLQPAPGLRDRR